MSKFLFYYKLARRRPLKRPAFKRERKSKLQIQHLPQDIVGMILSKLPLKDAVRSSILSSKWKRAWTCHPKLTFSIDTMLGACARSYTRTRCAATRSVYTEKFDIGVKEFMVEFGLGQKHAHHLDSWVSFAIKSKAKQIVPNFHLLLYKKYSVERYGFPFRLFDGRNRAHLRLLQLVNACLEPPPDFSGFPNLTALEVQFVYVGEDNLQSLLLKCHALEQLTLHYCAGFTHLRICHQLRRLEYLSVEGFVVKNLDINTIGLETIVHGRYVRDVVVHKASQLREVIANVGFGDIDTLQYILTGLPSTLPRLKALVVDIWEDIKMTEVPKCVNRSMLLRHLTLNIDLDANSKFDLLRLAHILEAAPCLEHFELNMHPLSPTVYDNELESPTSVPPCPNDHLKRVEFIGFIGYKDQIMLAKHILRNAKALELMIIEPRHKRDDGFLEEYDETEYGRKVAVKCLPPEDQHNVLTIL